MRRAPKIWLILTLALAACGKRDALNAAVTTHPGPDAAFQPYTPPDAGDEPQVVAPKPDAASTFEVPLAVEAGSAAEVRDAVGSACPVAEIPEGKFTALSAGNGSTCAIRADGALRCWGWLSYPQSDIPTGSFARVATGFKGCAVRETGEVVCWPPGDLLPTGRTFKDVGRGEESTCALATDGGIVCWREQGLAIAPMQKFESMSSGAYFTCAVDTIAHAATCWDPRVSDSITVTSGPFLEVSAGRFYACGLLMDHTPRCWPMGITGLNIGAPPPGTFREISAGEFTVCVLKDDGAPICWGSNQWGQAVPPAGARFQHISVGSTHACGILLDGTLTCWGTVPDPCAPG